jgi:hypothetical protein
MTLASSNLIREDYIDHEAPECRGEGKQSTHCWHNELLVVVHRGILFPDHGASNRKCNDLHRPCVDGEIAAGSGCGRSLLANLYPCFFPFPKDQIYLVELEMILHSRICPGVFYSLSPVIPCRRLTTSETNSGGRSMAAEPRRHSGRPPPLLNSWRMSAVPHAYSTCWCVNNQFALCRTNARGDGVQQTQDEHACLGYTR